MTSDMIKLYIEPTSRCNFNCTMCFRSTWFDEQYRDMPWDVFARAMDTMPATVQTVFFGGMGEPLVHPEIVAMVAQAHARGKRTELITNGTLLTEACARALIDAGLDMVWLSIDSFTDEAYDKIQRNGRFLTVTENLATLNRLRITIEPNGVQTVGRPELGLTFVAMKNNVQYLESLTDFARQYHVQRVNISNVLPSDAESEQQILYEDLVSNGMRKEGANEYLPKINLPMMDFALPQAQRALAALLSSHFNELSVSDVPLRRRAAYCRFVQEGNCFVRYDGNVAPCMGVLHNSVTYLWGQRRTIYHYSFGNLRHDDLAAIWESEPYAAFRKRVTDFSFSPCMYCGGCENREENRQDCYGNPGPTCGACLWAEGIIRCP